MKRGILTLTILFAYCISSAQPIIEENFIYPAGILTQVSGTWTENPVGLNDVQVLEGSLSYPGYASSGAGNMIFLDGGSGRSGIQRLFTTISGNGRMLFVSFLLNVSDTLDLTSGTICKLGQSSLSIRFYIYVQKIIGAGQYKIGIAKSISNILYRPNPMDLNVTYLIVAAYKFNDGADTSKLWVNPDLSGNMPPPDIINTIGLDAINLGMINFTPSTITGNEYIDGIRIDTTWAQAPLPVEISSFTADIIDDKVMLKWKTETEVDNYGFDIEKLTDRKDDSWKKIAFIEGYGNCNTPKYYSFTDEDIFNCTGISYRLKQIDNDGAYSRTKVITVIPALPSELFLFQNYPNPFNSSTKIRYKIPYCLAIEETKVEINLYNVLGNLTRCLVSDFKAAGVYEFSLNPMEYDLAAGVYFYSLAAGNPGTSEYHFTVKKLIVLK